MFKIVAVCKGGGYRYCRTEPPHPRRNSNGLYPLHRVLMENQLGRLLRGDEEVHHKDEDKGNDDPGNLELRTKAEHARLHHPPVERVEVKCPCGVSFSLKPHQLRLRQQRTKGPLSCSRRCGAIYSKQRG